MCFILNLSKGKFRFAFGVYCINYGGKKFLWEAKAELEMYCGKARVRNVTLCSAERQSKVSGRCLERLI